MDVRFIQGTVAIVAIGAPADADSWNAYFDHGMDGSVSDRAGDVNQVEGEPGAIDGDTATASTRIETSRAGELEWTFSLARREGVWRIAEWREQEPASRR
jgi:hypothetical protein